MESYSEKLFSGIKNRFCQSNLEEQRKSYINRKISIQTRTTGRKIQCVYIHVYQTKNWGPGPYNSLSHTDNGKYFSSLSNTKSKGSAHVSLGEGRGKNLDMLLLRKGNFIIINEFRYGQTWKIWPSPLSLSLYSTFNNQY